MPRLATSRRQAAGCAPLPSAHAGSRYARHAPERTLLYALVEAHYPDFIARIEAEGRSLPGYVREAFDAYLRCGVLEHGFLRVVCEHCRAERLVTFSCKKRGFCPSCGARRMAKRTTGPQRAHRQCKPRDDLPAAQPTAKPESEPMRPRSAGRRSARCRESAKHGC